MMQEPEAFSKASSTSLNRSECQFEIGTAKMDQFSMSEAVFLGLERGSSLRYTEG
jgi:hypothetical protein